MSAPSWIGKSLGGRYHIEQMLGQGGMSAVYKGNDPNLRRAVAIKLIHPHLSTDQRFVHRFEEEAAAVAQLRHPNIIQVYDFNQDEGTYYMVMEFIAGETLQDRLRRYNRSQRFIPLAKAVQYTTNICAAIAYAHKRGMVHRDIKPANIMIDVHDQAILMDFGIVKMVGADKFTATGAVVGTALYMPPEVIRGEVVDSRSDIYSLGVTLYEMVSGRPPFEADSAMTLMMMHLNDPAPDPTKLRPDLPPELAALIGRALAKERPDRFSSADEMAQALQALLPDLASQDSAVSATGVMLTPPAAPAISVGRLEGDQPTEIEQRPVTDPGENQPSEATEVDGGATEIERPKPVPARGIDYRMPAPATEIERAEPAAELGKTDPFVILPNLSEAAIQTDHPAANTQPEHQAVLKPPVRTAPAGAASTAASKNRPASFSLRSPLVIAAALGILAVLAILTVLAGLIFSNLPSRQLASAGATTPSESAGITQGTAQTAVLATGAETPTPTATSTQPPSATPPSTETPAPTLTPPPSATPTPDLFVVIKSITIENNQYIVDYETFGYTEQLPGMHVHFFFDTVSPENAGMPGSGPWKLYGGPRPFKDYQISDRPAQAVQMCALVANANHSVIPNSGVCLNLP